MGLVTVLVFFCLVALRVALVFLGAVLILRSARQCPACLAPTTLMHTPWLRRLLPRVEWRWCAQCGWQGPGRTPYRRRFQPRQHSRGAERRVPVPDAERSPRAS